jgi:hypothetical protein
MVYVAPFGNRSPTPTATMLLIQAGFEEWSRAEVVLGGIDRLASRESGVHVWWPVAHAGVAHANEGAVVRPQGHPNVLLERAIRANEEPVGPAVRENGAAETLALEVATRDGQDAPLAQRRGLEIVPRVHEDTHRE